MIGPLKDDFSENVISNIDRKKSMKFIFFLLTCIYAWTLNRVHVSSVLIIMFVLGFMNY